MKKVIGLSLTISGFLFSIFVLNVLMYAFMPGYRHFLNNVVVGNKRDIPVIEANNELFALPEQVEVAPAAVAGEVSSIIGSGDIADETIALSGEISAVTSSDNVSENQKNADPNKPQIIERTYHEDCGTGKGYWVIKYSDGSYGIE